LPLGFSGIHRTFIGKFAATGILMSGPPSGARTPAEVLAEQIALFDQT
jgi:hypothetical protein